MVREGIGFLYILSVFCYLFPVSLQNEYFMSCNQVWFLTSQIAVDLILIHFDLQFVVVFNIYILG